MHSKTTRPVRSGRVALVVEVEIPREGPTEWVRLVTSIPGREGTSSRVWTTGPQGLTPEAWADLQSAVLKTLSTALELLGGIQERMTL